MLDPERAMPPENLPWGVAPLSLHDASGSPLAELKSVAYEGDRRLVVVRLLGRTRLHDENYNYIYTPGNSKAGEVRHFAPLSTEVVDPKKRLMERLQLLERFAPRLFDTEP